MWPNQTTFQRKGAWEPRLSTWLRVDRQTDVLTFSRTEANIVSTFFKTLNRLLTTFSTFYVSLKGVVVFDVIFAWFSRWLSCNTAFITYQNRLRNSAFILVSFEAWIGNLNLDAAFSEASTTWDSRWVFLKKLFLRWSGIITLKIAELQLLRKSVRPDIVRLCVSIQSFAYLELALWEYLKTRSEGYYHYYFVFHWNGIYEI